MAENSLSIIPGVPKCYHSDPTLKTVLGCSSTVELLLEEKCSGFVILDQRHSRAIVSNADSQPYGFGCLFIPLTKGKIFLFKVISNVSDGTGMYVGQSVECQLQDLARCFDTSQIQVEVIVVCESKCGNIVKEAEELVKKNGQLVACFDLRFHSFLKTRHSIGFSQPKDAQRFKGLCEGGCSNPEIISNFIASFEEHTSLKITKKSFRSFGNETIFLTDVKKVSEIFHFYFPNRNKKIETVPNIDRILENLLYSTTSSGEIKGGERYIGEVKFFYEKVLSSLNNSSGIMLKNFDSKKVNSVLDSEFSYNMQFEIDWLYCGTCSIAAIEVGMSNNPEKPLSAFRNKLEQGMRKLLPTMKLIMFGFIENIYHHIDSDLSLDQLVSNFTDLYLKIVIFLPNITGEVLTECLKDLKHDKGQFEMKQKVARENKSFLKSMSIVPEKNFHHILLLLHANSAPGHQSLKVYSIDQEFNLTLTNSTLEDLFNGGDPESKLDSGLLSHCTALFSLGCLVFDDLIQTNDSVPVTIDEKYWETYSIWRNTKSQQDSTTAFLDIILSPQQHRILSEDKPRVCLVGEPGSGKTAMLAAKILLSAQDADVEHVFVVIPWEKKLLLQFFQEFVKKIDQPQLRRKVKIMELAHGDLGYRHEIIDTCTTEHKLRRSVILMDEFDLDRCLEEAGGIPFVSLILQVKAFWVVHIDVGRLVDQQSIFDLKDLFFTEPLNILFRSSHHICEFSSNYIHSSKPVTETTARVAGCYTSAQKQFYFHSFSHVDDAILVNESLVESKYSSDRIFVVFASYRREKRWRKTILQRTDALEERIFRVDGTSDHYNLNYTGCEAWSVVVVVDTCFETGKFKPFMDLAITRAHYEVCILVKSSLEKKLDWTGVLKTSPLHLEMFRSKQYKMPFNAMERIEELSEVGLINVALSAIFIGDLETLEFILKQAPEKFKINLCLWVLHHFSRIPSYQQFMDPVKETMGKEILATFQAALLSFTVDTFKQALRKDLENLIHSTLQRFDSFSVFDDTSTNQVNKMLNILSKKEIMSVESEWIKINILAVFEALKAEVQLICGRENIEYNDSFLHQGSQQDLLKQHLDSLANVRNDGFRLLSLLPVEYKDIFATANQLREAKVKVIGLLRLFLNQGNLTLLDWVLDLISDTNVQLLVTRWKDFLFYACMNGSVSVVKWALSLLQTHSCDLYSELGKTFKTDYAFIVNYNYSLVGEDRFYKHLIVENEDKSDSSGTESWEDSEYRDETCHSDFGDDIVKSPANFEENEIVKMNCDDEDVQHEKYDPDRYKNDDQDFDEVEDLQLTLLNLMCSRNAESDSIQLLLDSGFPSNLLALKYRDKSALHWAISHGNLSTVQVLLSDPERMRILLSVGYGNEDFIAYVSEPKELSASEYANILGHRDIEDYLESRELQPPKKKLHLK